MKNLEQQLNSLEQEFAPGMRWWLSEGSHTDQTLENDIKLLNEIGIGTVEFLAMDELDIDSSRYGWGSEEWTHDTQFILQKLTEHHMGASLTSGTNWSNANLPDYVHMPDDPSASKELDFYVEELAKGQLRSGKLNKPHIESANVYKQTLIAVVAVKVDSKKEDKIYLSHSVVLTDKVVNGELTWEVPSDGDYLLFSFWLHGTGQTASPSVSTNYTVNYLDKYGIDKLKKYWDQEVFTPEVRRCIKENGHIQMYMDSLELSTFGNGGQLWGYHLLEEFQERRGYDFTPYLPFIIRKLRGMALGPIDYYYELNDSLLLDKIRNDFYQTMTELYIDNMLKPMQSWLHEHGMTLRAEISYGLPFEISLPGKYVDGIETESLEFASQIDAYRGLAGVAHLYGKTFSSETGATFMNYMNTLDFFNQIIFTQFSAGVTKTILHGYASIAGGEKNTEWPGHEGMWPMFSERFGIRQPEYKFYKEWLAMLTRFQYILRKGIPRRDVAVLRTDYAFNNHWLGYPAQLGMDEKAFYEQKLMRENQGIYLQEMSLQNAGYSYDYFTSQLLEDTDVKFDKGQIQPDGPGYQALVLYQEELSLKSAEVILSYAQKGCPIIFANGLTETIQLNKNKRHHEAANKTPFNDGNDERLKKIIRQIKSFPNVREINEEEQLDNTLKSLKVLPRAGFVSPNSKIFTLTRKEDTSVYLYAYHYMYGDQEPYSTTIKIKGEGVPFEINCWSNEIHQLGKYEIDAGYTYVPITLQPGEATLFVIDTKKKVAKHALLSSTIDVKTNQDGELLAVVNESVQGRVVFNDGSEKLVISEVKEDIQLEKWALTVESWSKGSKQEITEDRDLGYVTTEVYYETSKQIIQVEETTLKPWKDIKEIGEAVSGVGKYKTMVQIQDLQPSDRCLLEIENTSGSQAFVYINGTRVSGFNMNRKSIDITDYLTLGENQLCIEVASTLANQLLKNGYYQKSAAISNLLLQSASGNGKEDEGAAIEIDANDTITIPAVQDYGIIGSVKLKFQTEINL